MILLDALYINNSGGKVLLDYLVEELHRANLPVFYLLDERVESSYPFLPRNHTTYLKANLFKRHRFYQKQLDRWSMVLCFGNIPPSIKLPCRVYTYFHQLQYLQVPNTLPVKKQVLLRLKREVVYRNREHSSYWLVQSRHMKELLSNEWGIPLSRIGLVPFYPPMPQSAYESRSTKEQYKKSFVYVSDGNPHKNHGKLLTAFERAFQEEKDISLNLTVSDQYPRLQERISAMKDRGIPVYNHGKVPKQEVSQLYVNSQFLVYPSLSESFGLGIIEGINMGCKVVGANLPYLYSVCNPSLVFDPYDNRSIYRAIINASSKMTPETTPLVENEINKLLELIQ